jgi:hypothetical protein
MDERGFETSLERMFGNAPALADADAFTRRVEGKLNRDWRWRTLGLGIAGVVGGAIAATQAVGSGLGVRVQEVSAASTQAVGSLYHQASTQADVLVQAGSGMSMFWLVSGVLIIAAIAGASRALDQV